MPQLTLSFASPAPVRAIGAQPEMACFGIPESWGADLINADFDMDRHQNTMWEDFWIEVLMHMPRQGQLVGVDDASVDERLYVKYKMLLVRTSPWAAPRVSRFRSCPDLPRFAQFKMCEGHLRRSASDGCLEVPIKASPWHLVDLWSPVVPDGDEELEDLTKFLMETMILTMPDAYHRALARGLMDPAALPAACMKLLLFTDLINVSAGVIGLPWAVTFRASDLRCDMTIEHTFRNIAAQSPPNDLPFERPPA